MDRCGKDCCAKLFWPALASWPRPCLNCGIGLVHAFVDVEDFEILCRCDSCDLWRYKDDREPLGPDDCLCVFEKNRPRPACPHHLRGPRGAPGPAGA